jgi:hypothetical protein
MSNPLTIGLCIRRDGKLLLKPAACPSPSLSATQGNTRFSQLVFYDDERGRRLIYELNPERDEFRYILEYDQPGGNVQRLVFPTLRGAIYCLANCVSRDE